MTIEKCRKHSTFFLVHWKNHIRHYEIRHKHCSERNANKNIFIQAVFLRGFTTLQNHSSCLIMQRHFEKLKSSNVKKTNNQKLYRLHIQIQTI